MVLFFRNKLEELAPSTGFRFNGNGYIIIDARAMSLRHRSYIHLSFKTFAPNGLLFLAGKENTFMSLEIKNGNILYQVRTQKSVLDNKTLTALLLVQFRRRHQKMGDAQNLQ